MWPVGVPWLQPNSLDLAEENGTDPWEGPGCPEHRLPLMVRREQTSWKAGNDHYLGDCNDTSLIKMTF